MQDAQALSYHPPEMESVETEVTRLVHQAQPPMLQHQTAGADAHHITLDQLMFSNGLPVDVRPRRAAQILQIHATGPLDDLRMGALHLRVEDRDVRVFTASQDQRALSGQFERRAVSL
ncbi:MAG: hypothetical protein BWY79_00389 [Actinobacteria bacterium ADurb.Bin444]|nr:MAG: hypothetical protein BWY79_00389 [Actinobacteria bacterium ADurb.Bin444]